MEKNMKHYNIEQDMRYLQLLSQSFPTIAEAYVFCCNRPAIGDPALPVRRRRQEGA